MSVGENEARVSDETKAQYEQLLESYRNSKSSDPIPNRVPWQARLAVHALIKGAVEEQNAVAEGSGEPVTVRILTSSLPAYVFDVDTIKSLKAFHDAGGKVQVLVWNDELPEIEDPFWESLEDDRSSFRLSGTTEYGESLNHLCIVGNKAYRLEAPHKHYSATDFSECFPDVPARICFNDPQGAGQTIDFFDQLWQHCGS